MRRALTAAAVAAVMVVSTGGTALAGEVTGNGKPTAIGVLGDGRGASSLVPIIRSEGPGVSCRGYASQR